MLVQQSVSPAKSCVFNCQTQQPSSILALLTGENWHVNWIITIHGHQSFELCSRYCCLLQKSGKPMEQWSKPLRDIPLYSLLTDGILICNGIWNNPYINWQHFIPYIQQITKVFSLLNCWCIVHSLELTAKERENGCLEKWSFPFRTQHIFPGPILLCFMGG